MLIIVSKSANKSHEPVIYQTLNVTNTMYNIMTLSLSMVIMLYINITYYIIITLNGKHNYVFNNLVYRHLLNSFIIK